MKIKVVLTILALTVLISALNAEILLAQKFEYKLQPTDVLNITVHEHEDLLTKTRVTSDGYITFPLLGKVKTEGLTVQVQMKQLQAQPKSPIPQ